MTEEIYEDIDEKEEIEDVCEKERMLAPREHLEALLYQFVKLYERWSEDRQVAAKQGADIDKFIKEFASEVERFSKLENAVIGKLKKGLEQTTVSISAMVHDAVYHAVNKNIDDSAGKMKDSVRHAENLLSEYQSVLNWSHWKVTAITALTSVTACLLVVWWLMPKPTLPLTDPQIQTYQAGQFLQSFWPKLSERQQKWLNNVALDKSNNREKLVEDVKKKYTGLSDEQANEMVN